MPDAQTLLVVTLSGNNYHNNNGNMRLAMIQNRVTSALACHVCPQAHEGGRRSQSHEHGLAATGRLPAEVISQQQGSVDMFADVAECRGYHAGEGRQATARLLSALPLAQSFTSCRWFAQPFTVSLQRPFSLSVIRSLRLLPVSAVKSFDKRAR
jgi:hypothetical protein